MEGLARDEDAWQVSWALPTLKSRLEPGRQLLRFSLTRRGLTLSTVLSAALLGQGAAWASLPAGLVLPTLRAALTFAGQAGPGPRRTTIALAEGMVQALAGTRRKVGATLLLAAGILAAGATLLARPATPP